MNGIIYLVGLVGLLSIGLIAAPAIATLVSFVRYLVTDMTKKEFIKEVNEIWA